MMCVSNIYFLVCFFSLILYMDCLFLHYASSALLYSVTGLVVRQQVNDVMWYVAGHTHSDLQPAAVSILNGPSKDCGHIAYFHADAFTWTQFKFTPTNRQVVNLQTVKCRSITRFNFTLCVNLCMCACVCPCPLTCPGHI